MPDGTTKTTRYLGKAYERTLTVAPGGSTTTEDRYFIHAAGRLVAIHTENRTDNQARNRFLHRDALGTVTLITDALGQVVERYAFRPFGERAVIEPPGDLPGWTIPAGVTPRLKRGFTGHEHIEGVGLIHMNGRVYDPRLGRFLSADPSVQFIDQPRSYNRYVYAQNNPLKYTDPSGYFLSAFVAWAFQAIVANYIQHRLIGAFVTGFLTGLLLSGGDVEAGLKSGVVAVAFSAVGDSAAQRAAEHPAVGGGDAAWASGGWKKVVAHATVGGAQSELNGGNFRDGAIGAGFGQAMAPAIDGIRSENGGNASVTRVAAAAVVGGTGSALSGGRFANGAATAAFGRMFNDEKHHLSHEGSSIDNAAYETEGDFYEAMMSDKGAVVVDPATGERIVIKIATGMPPMSGRGKVVRFAGNVGKTFIKKAYGRNGILRGWNQGPNLRVGPGAHKGRITFRVAGRWLGKVPSSIRNKLGVKWDGKTYKWDWFDLGAKSKWK